jgi:ABC-type sugar transport system substrate-binding protein
LRSSGGPALVGSVLLAFVLAGGCDSASFVPPLPEELRTGDTAPPAATPPPAPDLLPTALSATKAVELILNRHEPEEAEILKSAARVQAGFDKVKLKIAVSGETVERPGERAATPPAQLELVREALARHPTALIIEPADPKDPKLLETIEDARTQGVPVVLIDQQHGGSEPNSANRPATKSGDAAAGPATGKGSGAAPPSRSTAAGTVIVVSPPPFAKSAPQLVASAMRNAKNAGLDPRAGAILAVNTAGDPSTEIRAAALVDALKDAGITEVDEVRFSGGKEGGIKVLTERFQAKPKSALVFVVDAVSMTAVREVGTKLGEGRPFILAGYTSDENIGNLVRMGSLAAAAEFNPVRLVRKAINAGVAAARGKDVTPHLELEATFHDSPPSSGLPKPYGSRPRQEPFEKKGP